MANAREIIRRRNSVGSITKLTKTMEMVSTSRFRQIQKRALGARPYRDELTNLINTLTKMNPEITHPLLTPNQDVKQVGLLIFSSNRGLCGGFNAGIYRLAEKENDKLVKAGHEVLPYVCGKKGIHHYHFKNIPIRAGYTDFDERTSYATVEGLADYFIQEYTKSKLHSVRVVYTRFISNATQQTEVWPLLPLARAKADKEPDPMAEPAMTIDSYEFSPSSSELMMDLIPSVVRAQLYQCFIDSLVSEQAARMTAMSAATANGEQMNQALTQQYNRVRQSQITGELLDIMGGVEALKK